MSLSDKKHICRACGKPFKSEIWYWKHVRQHDTMSRFKRAYDIGKDRFLKRSKIKFIFKELV
jgi:uncharacterized Zn-finger protein